MPSTPPSQAERAARRNEARHRVVQITRATAVAAALTTGTVAVLAATTARHATTTAVAATPTADATTLSAATSTPEMTDQPPVAASGGS